MSFLLPVRIMAAGANDCDAVVVFLNEYRSVDDMGQARLPYGTPWADTTLPEAPPGLEQCPIVFVRQIGLRACRLLCSWVSATRR